MHDEPTLIPRLSKHKVQGFSIYFFFSYDKRVDYIFHTDRRKPSEIALFFFLVCALAKANLMCNKTNQANWLREISHHSS